MPPVNLAREQQRIDDRAEVVDHVVGDDLDQPGLRIDLHLADVRAVGEGRGLRACSGRTR